MASTRKKSKNIKAKKHQPSIPLRVRLTKFTGYFLLALTLVVSLWGINYIRQPGHFPITQVAVDASFEHVSHAQLKDIIGPLVTGNFFTVNASAIKRQLNTLAWVKSVTINRVWPNQLVIHVVEQQAVAQWNADGLLTPDGSLIYPAKDTFPTGLPMLAGPADDAVAVWKMYQYMAALLVPLDLTISQLTLDPRYAWEMTLNTGTKVLLGRLDVEQRLQRFVAVYAKIFQGKSAPITIDLRYNNGLAVKWQNKN